jgi:nitrate reductase NapE component
LRAERLGGETMRWGITGCITALLLGMASMGWAQGPGFAQEDRDRLIRLEASLQVFMEQVDKRFEQVDKRITELREDMNKRFEQVDKRFEQVDKRITELREDMNKRFEELITFMWILAGVFTALTVAVIGFAYWDRRTIIRRAKLETIEELEERGKLRALLEAMRAVAAKDSTMADALRRFNLL